MPLAEDTKYSLKLLNTISDNDNDDDNLIFSPLSIGSLEGSLEQTEVMNKVKKEENVNFEVSNTIFVKKGCQLPSNFENSSFDVKIMDETSEPFLLNEFTFKSKLDVEFNPAFTENQIFISESRFAKKIPFLSSYSTNQLFSSDDDFDVVQFDYMNRSFKFVIFLPKNRSTTLKSSIEKLNSTKLEKLVTEAPLKVVNVKIPKLNISKELEMSNILEQLGFNIRVVHKANFELKESSENAAQRSSPSPPPSPPAPAPEPIDFIANRPFIYSITYLNQPILLGTFLELN